VDKVGTHRPDDLEGAKTTGHGIFTHNLIKIAALTTKNEIRGRAT